MIIQLISETYRRGYLPRSARNSVAPFFACANLAVKKAVYEAIGGFDPDLRTGEDIDLCMRVMASGAELYFEPDVRVHHHNRETVRELLRQWFNYGRYHARLFEKHNPRAVEILLLNPERDARARYTTVYYSERWPARALVFVTPFAVGHAALAGALAAGALQLHVVAVPLAAIGVASLASYLLEDLRGDDPLGEKLVHAGLRYVVNAALLTGGLVGGAENGYLYVYGTLWQRSGEP